MVGGAERGETPDIERLHIRSVESPVHRPFEPSDVGEIRSRTGRRKPRQEFGEVGAVLVEIGAPRWPLFDEDPGGALEEFVADQAMDRRIGEAQRRGQTAEEGVAIDAETRGRVDAVGADVHRRVAILTRYDRPAHPVL